MKKTVLLSVLFGMISCSMMAQDDLYFTPKKASKVVSTVEEVQDEKPAFHPGSNRDVDEYNRRGKLSSYYQKIGEDSLGNDIIVFHAGDGSYDISKADTVYRGSGTFYDDSDNYAYSRRMSRFDGWYDPWFYGHSYYPWYDAWYDPWYYGYGYGWRWRYGWYDPWYYGHYGYYGWGWPYYGYGYYGWGYPRGYGHFAHSGTRNHSFPRYNGRDNGRGSYGRNQANRSFGNRTRSYGNTTNRSWNNNNSWNNAPARSNSSMGSFGGGSFGGSRSGGFGGGSRSGGGGGGHFGGRR